MMVARVSVIITSYNQANYLREAIESVIGQTSKPHEIIIADDHSMEDNSVEVIHDYAAGYPDWIRPLFQHKNVGIPRNRNSALRVVTGNYVTILDGDDRLLPRFIEAHLAALSQCREAGCTYGNRYDLKEDGQRRLYTSALEPSGDILAYVAAGRAGLLRSMIARYNLVKAVGLLDEAFYHHDGFVLSMRLAKIAKFVYVREPLMEKREHSGGVSKTISRAERARCVEELLAEIKRLTIDLPSSEQRRIEKVWSGRVVRERVLAEVAAGNKFKAFLNVAREFTRDPLRLVASWKLTREIIRGGR
jgi:glycosyltransferase involved in cell wall biosynthesis